MKKAEEEEKGRKNKKEEEEKENEKEEKEGGGEGIYPVGDLGGLGKFLQSFRQLISRA